MELTQATFEGNAPTTVGSNMFALTHDGFKVFYYTGAEGFTNPWNGYTTEATIINQVTEELLKNTYNGYGVSGCPTASQPSFIIEEPYAITYIDTYHCYDTTSDAGTIALRNSDTGILYGLWNTTKYVGGDPNYIYWINNIKDNNGAFEDMNTLETISADSKYVIIPAGTYYVVDSKPETWSNNGDSSNQGFTLVKGYKAGSYTTVSELSLAAVNMANSAESMGLVLEYYYNELGLDTENGDYFYYYLNTLPNEFHTMVDDLMISNTNNNEYVALEDVIADFNIAVATAAVYYAESSPSSTTIDGAQGLITGLLDGDAKTVLNSRLANLVAAKSVAADYCLQFKILADEAIVTGYTGSDTNIIIPTKLGVYNITSIDNENGTGVFSGNTTMTSITIPEYVEYIGDNTFNGCTLLTYAYFEGNAPAIGNDIFTGTSVTVNYYEGKTGYNTATWSDFTRYMINLPPGVTIHEVMSIPTTSISIEFNQAVHNDTLAITDRVALIHWIEVNGTPLVLDTLADSVVWNVSNIDAPIVTITIPSTTFTVGDIIDLHFKDMVVKDLQENAISSDIGFTTTVVFTH